MEAWREQVKYIIDNGYALWLFYAPGFDFWQSYVREFNPNQGVKTRITQNAWLDK